jgi:hypothetical protein
VNALFGNGDIGRKFFVDVGDGSTGPPQNVRGLSRWNLPGEAGVFLQCEITRLALADTPVSE